MSSGTFKFDKFIDDITKREKGQKTTVQEVEESGQRKYNRLYRELWQNRIKWFSHTQETKK